MALREKGSVCGFLMWYSLHEYFLTHKRSVMPKHTQKNKEIAKKKIRIFGKNLREARIQSEIEQREVVDRSGLTQSFISRVENGKTNIGLGNAAILADAVGQPLCRLLRSEDD